MMRIAKKTFLLSPSAKPISTHSKSAFLLLSRMLLSTMLLIGCSQANDAGSKTDKQVYYHSVVTTALIPLDGYKVNRRFSGTTQSMQVANLNLEVPGRVQSIYAFEGNQVQKGQLLATLDSELLHIELKQLSAQLQQIDAEMVLAKSSLNRVNTLIDDGYTSVQSFDEITAQLQVLEATRQQLQASINAKNYQIKHTKIIAPFDGVVNKRNINIGEVVNSSTIAFEVQQSAHNELKVGVPQNLIKQIAQQQRFSLVIEGKHIEVAELAINTQINRLSRTIQLRFELPKDLKVFNNQIGYFEFEQFYPQPGYWVPVTAITDGIRGTWNIYTLQAQEESPLFKLIPHSVDVIHVEQDRAFIRANLDEQQPLLAGGLHKVVPNQLVKINTLGK